MKNPMPETTRALGELGVCLRLIGVSLIIFFWLLCVAGPALIAAVIWVTAQVGWFIGVDFALVKAPDWFHLQFARVQKIRR